MNKIVCISAFCLFMAASLPAAATTEHREREALARLLHEVNALFTLLDEAQKMADYAAPLRFEYGYLRRDLTIIKQGIEAHLNTPPEAARDMAPLRGDYQR